MEELDLIKQQLELLRKENDVLGKGSALEFERISKAFGQLGNLLDLVYLEINVLIELCIEKKTFSQEEFTKSLEATAKKVEEQITKAAAEEKKIVVPEKL